MEKSYNDIRNITEDWALDDRNNLPYSGQSVQNFIKATLNSKAGDFYYDADSNRYLIFSDESSRNLYLSDREEYSNLILGTFDAPANYTTEIYVTTPSNNIILKGTTGNMVKFTFDVKNKTGASTGESVIVSYNINNSGNVTKLTQIYDANTEVEFLVDDYLSDGTNTINIVVTGRNSLASTMAAINFTVVALDLKSDFDFSVPVKLGDYLSIPYTLSGLGVKYIEWFLDDNSEPLSTDTITDIKVNTTKNISTNNLSIGKHTIQIRSYFENNTVKYYGHTLYFDFVVCPQNEIWQEHVTYILLSFILTNKKEPNASLTFNTTRYKEFKFDVSVYNSRSENLELLIYDNNTQINSLYIEPTTIQQITYTPETSGNHELTFSCNGVETSISTDSDAGSININEYTENLVLKLTANGRSNNEVNPAQWTYNGIETTFNDFEWNEQSGWIDGALVIPANSSIDINYKPLLTDPLVNGRTIEIDYETSKIDNDDAVVMSLINSDTNAGLEITASTAKLQSSGGANVNTKYRGGDRVHLTFIINKTTGDNGCLMFIVNNGILERASNYVSTHKFTVNKKIHIGSDGCTVKIHSIKVYDTALTVDQALCNYGISSDNIVQFSNNNDIFNSSGFIDVDKVNSKIPVMIITGNMEPIFTATNKNAETYVDIEYRNLQDPSKDFTATHVRMKPQGTSSLGYPRKNLRPYTASKYNCVMYDANGEVIENGLYAFKDNAQPVNCWTLKADYAESSGSHNTGIARLWNDLMYNCQIDGEYVLRTQAQKTALVNGYNYDVRTTVDGFPMVVFHRTDTNSPLICLGQYNFNNDKSTEKVFGFTDIPGFDNTNVQCFEFLANENSICLFDDISDFDNSWDEAFESRYPDTKTPNLAPLKTLATWINSCKNNQTKWNDEKSQHFDLYKLAAYYVYLMRFGAIDQTVKNAMITTEDGQHWFFINYDNDTVLGIDNNATVLNAWNYDRNTQKPSGSYYYAGHNSVLWNCFEADQECMDLVYKVDEALYSAGLTYQNIINMFDTEQCDKWCERIYNDNGIYKYIKPFKENGSAVLHMLQGSRKSYRKWWLQHRIDMYDAIWATGEFKNRIIQFKVEDAPSGGTFTITSALNTFFGYGINNNVKQSGVSLSKDQSYTFTINQALAIGDPVKIFNANNIKEINLSSYITKLRTLDFSYANGNDGENSIKSIILGNGTDTNNTLEGGIGGIQNLKYLETLDIRKFTTITDINLTNLYNLNTFLAIGSGLTNFEPANGVKLSNVSLPTTLQSLILNNASVSTLNYAPTTSLRTVSLKKVTTLGSTGTRGFITNWLNLFTDDQLYDLSLTLDGINWTYTPIEQVLKLSKVGNKNLQGKITLQSITQEGFDTLIDTFGPNVFNPNSKFVISAPNGFLITGPTVLVAGDNYKYTAAKFPIEEGQTCKYLLYTNDNTLVNSSEDSIGTYREFGGVKLYEESGNVIVDNNISQSVTLKVGAEISGTYSDKLTVTAGPLVLPNITITEGNDRIMFTGNYDYTFDLGTYNAKLINVEATIRKIDGTNASAEIVSVTGNKVTINAKSVPENDANFRLTIIAHCNQGDSQFTKNILFKSPMIIMTSESNPEVLAVCYAHGWCASPSQMTEAEAAQVTSINDYFSSNQNITHFEEFQYFTKVTAIYYQAFAYCSKLTSITIPDSVTSISNYAFQNCSGLTSITIPDSVTSINSGAFSNCSRLTKVIISDIESWCNISFSDYSANPLYYAHHLYSDENTEITNLIIPNTITSIKSYAFYGCSGLTNVTIPDSVTSIGISAFSNCSSLTKVIISNIESWCNISFNTESANPLNYARHLYSDENTEITNLIIPNTITSIKSYAFYGCSGLTNVTIPDSVTSIGISAFSNCSSLTKVIISNIESWCNISFNTESANPLNYARHLYSDENTEITNLIIPNTVTSIGNYAFYCCSGLTSVTIPDSVTSIGYYVFSSCSGLTSVTIGNSVTSIGTNAFSGCSGLTSITIPDSVTSIAGYVFYSCSGLTSVTIGNSVTSIGKYTFSGCSSITSITIPDSVTSIDDGAFRNCYNLRKVIISDIESWCNISFNDYEANPLNYAQHLYLISDENTEITSLIIPNTVTSIGSYAFYNCRNLTSITIGNSVTSIGSSAFYNCWYIKNITLPNTITSIGNSAFYNWQSLTNITIPDSVTSIGTGAFSNCSGLISVTINSNSVTSGTGITGSTKYFINAFGSQVTEYILGSNITSIGSSMFTRSSKVNTLICYSLTAPTVQDTTFKSGSYTIGSSASSPKKLIVYSNATGYNASYWQSVLIDQCGFTLEQTL